MTTPHIVCLGGSLRPASTTGLLTTWCAAELTAMGVRTSVFEGDALDLPHYRPLPTLRGAAAQRLVSGVAEADGVLLVSPTYHGTVPGVLKNALDYLNDLAGAPSPFLDGRPVGCVAVGDGDQGAYSTLATLRTIAHALRGWPTPLGITATSPAIRLDAAGVPSDGKVAERLRIMLDQIVTMARRASPSIPEPLRDVVQA
ncbi:NADPH-dependent FMN reductase [Actinokineospora enzanensis]|uniref:NADPH-dependent FMN reductase n=1 Tax=Actinokineospora enzanensis TaxID=155975 RepID=UPI00036A2F4E|nr:NADPH-dependent FMN reductase [Actinokineospora enzanensis]